MGEAGPCVWLRSCFERHEQNSVRTPCHREILGRTRCGRLARRRAGRCRRCLKAISRSDHSARVNRITRIAGSGDADFVSRFRSDSPNGRGTPAPLHNEPLTGRFSTSREHESMQSIRWDIPSFPKEASGQNTAVNHALRLLIHDVSP